MLMILTSSVLEIFVQVVMQAEKNAVVTDISYNLMEEGKFCVPDSGVQRQSFFTAVNTSFD